MSSKSFRDLVCPTPDDLGRHLIASIPSCNLTLAAALIRQGANVNYVDEEGMTALHHAAGCCARFWVRLLVASGKCDYLIQDRHGRYASDLASEWGRDYPVARLLRKKQRGQADALGVPAWTPHKRDDAYTKAARGPLVE